MGSDEEQRIFFEIRSSEYLDDPLTNHKTN